MKRRAFIAALGSAAAMWPFAARAQQAERMRRIGVVSALAADDPEWQARLVQGCTCRRHLNGAGLCRGEPLNAIWGRPN